MAAVISYDSLMQRRIADFSPSLRIQQILGEKVKEISQRTDFPIAIPIRSPLILLGHTPSTHTASTLSVPEQVDTDFRTAVREFGAMERHVFRITAPPPLTPVSLNGSNLSLSQNQSIIRHCVRSAADVILISRAFRVTNAIRGIIPLSNERLVVHNLTRRFVLNFCLKGELSTELTKIIPSLTLRFFRSMHPALKPGLRDDIQLQAHNYLEGSDKEIDPILRAIIDTLMNQANSSDLHTDQIRAIVAMRAADIIMETYIKESIDQYDMSSAPELTGYKPLPPQSKKTRRIFMINGGVASGKSSAQSMEAARAAVEGVEWATVCCINRDALKPMLLSAADVDVPYRAFFASFTEDEAFLMRDAILREYQQRLTTDTAPHLYIDQVSPTQEMLHMAGAPDSNGLDLTVVYTPVEFSLCMAQGREKETGYAAVTKGVLNSHASVPSQLLESIESVQKDGRTNIRLRIVANVARGVVKSIAEIDFAKRKGSIGDMTRLLDFFHKEHINREATRFAEIYPENLPPPATCCTAKVTRLMKGLDAEFLT